MHKFNKLNLSTGLMDYLNDNNFSSPTDVQSQVIPKYLSGDSLSVVSSTGSGKTLAFLLPLFEVLKADERVNGNYDVKDTPRAVILCPTRELAKQISNVAKSISHFARLRVRTLLTGEVLQNQVYDILITVPGKLKAAIENKRIDGNGIRHLILDEADQLIELGFLNELKKIVSELTFFQAGLFSATTSESSEELKEKLFSDKTFSQVQSTKSNVITQQVDTYNIYLGSKQKRSFLLEFMKKNQTHRGLVFVNRGEEIRELKEFIEKEGKFKCPIYFLHGKADRKERLQIVEKYRSHKSILICTDIMARGIDIPSTQWVLNYDLPFEAAYYVHRCGRVGRAKNTKGLVYNFVTQEDQNIIKRINEAIAGQSALNIDRLKLPRQRQSDKLRGRSGAIKKNSNNTLRSDKLRSNRFKRRPRFARK